MRTVVVGDGGGVAGGGNDGHRGAAALNTQTAESMRRRDVYL